MIAEAATLGSWCAGLALGIPAALVAVGMLVLAVLEVRSWFE